MVRHASGATITSPPGSFGDRWGGDRWGELRVTVEPAREIGARRLRGGRTRFRRARTILDYIPKAGYPSPGPTVEAVAMAGPVRPVPRPALKFNNNGLAGLQSAHFAVCSLNFRFVGSYGTISIGPLEIRSL